MRFFSLLFFLLSSLTHLCVAVDIRPVEGFDDKIFVAGGVIQNLGSLIYPGVTYIKDFSEEDLSCDIIINYPEGISEAVGTTFEGRPLICGGLVDSTRVRRSTHGLSHLKDSSPVFGCVLRYGRWHLGAHGYLLGDCQGIGRSS